MYLCIAVECLQLRRKWLSPSQNFFVVMNTDLEDFLDGLALTRSSLRCKCIVSCRNYRSSIDGNETISV